MKKIISAALLTLAVGGVNAEVYVGGTYGVSKVSNLGVDCTGATSCDKTDAGGKVYVGYSDHAPSVAFELGYMDFGKLDVKIGTVAVEAKNEAAFVAAAWRGNFTPQLGGIARLGFAWVKTECRVTAPGARFNATNDEVNVTPIFGVGLDYAISKNWKAVTALDITQGECEGEKGRLGLLSIGAQYSF